jgi:hypothetical protein
MENRDPNWPSQVILPAKDYEKMVIAGSVLRTMLHGTAQEIAREFPELEKWSDWVLYLLEELDGLAQKEGRQEEFEGMLAGLQDELEIRIAHKSWWATVISRDTQMPAD